MGYYKNEPLEKAYQVFAEKEKAVLEADVELAPHQAYTRDDTYKMTGLGSMFDGTYRFKKVIHLINPSGYSVHATARMVYDKRGNYVENGSTTASTTPAKPKVETKTKSDMTYTVKSGDTLYGIAAKYCKSSNDWKQIEKDNHAVLVARDKRNASDLGHWIYPGMKLKISGTLLK